MFKSDRIVRLSEVPPYPSLVQLLNELNRAYRASFAPTVPEPVIAKVRKRARNGRRKCIECGREQDKADMKHIGKNLASWYCQSCVPEEV
jgi:DNA helicase HerA-like ATPase